MNSSSSLRVFYYGNFPLVNSFCPHYPPLHASAFCRYPGMMAEIITLLAKETGMRIIPVTMKDLIAKGLIPDDDHLKNVHYDVSSNELAFLNDFLDNGTIDLIADPEQRTVELEERFQFSEMLFYTATQVITRRKYNDLDHLWSFFGPYRPETWAFMLVAWLVQMLACVVMSRVEARITNERPAAFFDTAWRVCRVVLLQPEQIPFRTKAGKFSLLVFSFLQCILILGVFASLILASMLAHHPSTYQKIAGLIRHLQRNEYHLVTSNANWTTALLSSTNSYPFSDIRRALENNPPRVVDTPEAALEALQDEDNFLFQLMDSPTYFLSRKLCGLVAITDEMPRLKSYFLYRRQSPFIAAWDRAIRDNRMIIQQIVKKYSNDMQRYSNCEPRPSNQQLKLPPYVGLSIVCLGIILVAAVMLAAEVGIHRWKRRKDVKRVWNLQEILNAKVDVF
ncbi:PBPb domain-containing protein [Aphelenchoides fujianensis]|nr:PBPb domain-containing protein [Aphelenchoides fujianensis]